MRLFPQLCRQTLCCWFLAFAFVPDVLAASNHCKLPGEILIGQDKSYYYCSRKSCTELGAQLDSDKRALERLRSSIENSNAELQQWTEENAKAEKKAIEHAKQFLVETVLGGFANNREAKLKEMIKDIKRADPTGTTWHMKLIRVANFERSYVRLHALVIALKAIEYPGTDISKTWTDFRERAKAIGEETRTLAATWNLLATDPDTQQAFKEHGFEFSANSLKLTLNVPFVSQGLDLGQFLLADYGYDASQWELSRERIMQNLALDDKNLYAECLLSRQMLITFRDYNICRGKMPNLDGPRPEDTQCTDRTSK